MICPQNTKLMEATTRCEFRIRDTPSKVVFVYTKLPLLSKVLKRPEVSNGAPETHMNEKLPNSDKVGAGFHENTKEEERERDSE